MDGWVAFMRHAGIDPERISHVLADHRENDIAESSSVQGSYLRAAGFAPAEIIWSWEKFAFFYAVKPMLAERADAAPAASSSEPAPGLALRARTGSVGPPAIARG